MRLATPLVLIALSAAGIASPALAQGPWSVFVGGGAAGFGGASAPSPGYEEVTGYIKPSPTTRLHLGAARSLGRAGVALDVSYAKAGLGGYGDGGSYSLSPAMTLYDFRLLASYEAATPGGSSLRVALGPMLQVWSGDAILDTQTRLGGAAAVTLAVPVTKAFGVVVSGSLGVAASPFDADLLNSEAPLEPASLWTRELGVGVRLSL